MTRYEVTVLREDGAWVADVRGAGLGSAATQTDRFADLDTEVRDLVAGLTDTDPGSFGLAWRYLLDGRDVTSVLVNLAEREHAYREAAAARDAARREVIRTLLDARLSQSAIGDVLGLSHQRIHQIAKTG